MKIKKKIIQEIEVVTLQVLAYPRYWEDAKVNGVEDTEGTLIPCREGDLWRPLIDLESGIIQNWKKGTKAEVHYKVCDRGTYHILDIPGHPQLSIEENYVPSIMCPDDNGYGDYIIMDIDENGQIKNWWKNPPIEDFYREDS